MACPSNDGMPKKCSIVKSWGVVRIHGRISNDSSRKGRKGKGAFGVEVNHSKFGW
jgi:hypothetical protein